jgi:hypothetical protein
MGHMIIKYEMLKIEFSKDESIFSENIINSKIKFNEFKQNSNNLKLLRKFSC